MRRLRPNVITLALGLALAVAAQAKTTDRNAPMDITADKTDAVLTDDSDSTLTGNVLITQGSMEIVRTH